MRGRRGVAGYFLKTTYSADGGSAIDRFINLYCELEGGRVVDSDLVPIELWSKICRSVVCSDMFGTYAYIVSPL